jgi:hypothetical protein
MTITADQRRELWRATPRVDLLPEHTCNCRALPDRNALLDTLPKGSVGVEIGVAEGEFSAEILRRATPSRLHLVDAWEGERYGPGLNKVSARFSEQIAAGVVHIHRGLSTVVLERFAAATLDWAYIDTDHTYATTFEELVLCAAKVKPDGRIMGHDFCTGNVITPVLYGVIQASHKFCVEHGWQYEYITLESHGRFSFSLRRR